MKKNKMQFMETLKLEDLNTPIDNYIQYLQKFKEKYPNCEIALHYEYDADFPNLYLWAERLETDEEYKSRINMLKKAEEEENKRREKYKKDREEKDYQTYLKLKKKYEK